MHRTELYENVLKTRITALCLHDERQAVRGISKSSLINFKNEIESSYDIYGGEIKIEEEFPEDDCGGCYEITIHFGYGWKSGADGYEHDYIRLTFTSDTRDIHFPYNWEMDMNNSSIDYGDRLRKDMDRISEILLTDMKHSSTTDGVDGDLRGGIRLEVYDYYKTPDECLETGLDAVRVVLDRISASGKLSKEFSIYKKQNKKRI